MINLLLGQIPEAIYFALFMIFVKKLKEKRLLFIFLMIIEYLLLKYSFIFNIYFQVFYTILTFLTLKVLYKEKSQIIDIFTFAIGSLVLMIINLSSYFLTLGNILFGLILSRILIIIFFIVMHKKLNKIQRLYIKLWNRNDRIKKKIKTTTFRSANVVIFNLMYYIINLGIIYTIFVKGR